MKLINFLVLLLLATTTHVCGWAQFVDYEYRAYDEPLLDRGNYRAIVKYSSHTGESATYSLVVTVDGTNHVTAIHFPDGGSVHNGMNHSGYAYEGGKLYVNSRDSYGNVTSMRGTVTVRYCIPHWQQFIIYIE